MGKKGREHTFHFMVILRKAKSFLRILREDIKYIFKYPTITLKRMDYEEYWGEMQDINIKERTRIFSKIIKPGSTVLDIGCGTGTNLKYLIENNNVIAEGIDISSTAVQIAKKRGINAWVSDITQEQLNLDKKYDYILLSEVLEHIASPETLLSKLKEKFEEGVIVSVPNIGLYKHRLRLLFGRFPIQWAFHPGEHLRFWTLRDFRWWVQNQGFRITDSYPSNGFPIIYKHFPSLFANMIVYILKRHEGFLKGLEKARAEN